MARSVGLTPESREHSLCSLALDVAEKQMIAGTASPLIIAHFLRISSQRAELELEKLRNENALIAAKTSAIKSEEREDERYQEVIDAMRRYTRSSDIYE